MSKHKLDRAIQANVGSLMARAEILVRVAAIEDRGNAVGAMSAAK